jgi:VIT1/CCC1 family predicted Fe2+/Mn2+ transporter
MQKFLDKLMENFESASNNSTFFFFSFLITVATVLVLLVVAILVNSLYVELICAIIAVMFLRVVYGLIKGK